MTPAHESERERVIEVNPGDLSPETRRGLAEEFGTRESTD